MSSADLNSGNHDFSHPERLVSTGELVRIYGGLSPKTFFNELVRTFGGYASLNPDLDRAVFLHARMCATKGILWRWAIASLAILTAPLASSFVPSEWRLWPLLSGFAAEAITVLVLGHTHQKWIACRKDYTSWLRIVHRRASNREV